MNQRGFSIIELVVVLAIIAVLLSVATLDFSSMNRKYQIEKEARELYSAITKARLSSMQNKQYGALLLGPKEYVFIAYTSPDYPAGVTGSKTLDRVNVPYEIKKLNTTTGVPGVLDENIDKIAFDIQGFTNNNMTLVVTPTLYSGGNDCIIVHTARTNIGGMTNATTCTVQ
jgi:prepilin-type N-terminal cleavage/methylation domain-containing protein